MGAGLMQSPWGKNQPTLYVILKVAAALGYEPGALVTMVERAMAEMLDSAE